MAMVEIVLRVRLIGGEHLDVTYEDAGATPDEMVEQVILILAEDSGVLRCRHGDRLMVLYGRGVATLEVAPRGAVLLPGGQRGRNPHGRVLARAPAVPLRLAHWRVPGVVLPEEASQTSRWAGTPPCCDAGRHSYVRHEPGFR